MAQTDKNNWLDTPVKKGSILMMAGAAELLWAGIYYTYGTPPTAPEIAQGQQAAIVVRSAQEAFNKSGSLHVPVDARHNPVAAAAIKNCIYLAAETVTQTARSTAIEQGRLLLAYPTDVAAINSCLQQKVDALQHGGEMPVATAQNLRTVHATATGTLAAISIATIGVGAWRRYRQPSVL